MMEQLPDHNGAKVCDEGNIFFSEKIVIKENKEIEQDPVFNCFAPS
jgi:hypothetical protein